ncbi:MAG: sulfurtransferase TusA family protein [Raoultibacter sp.]
MVELDARGLFCPEPLMMAKAAMDAHPADTICILVDTAPPRDNIVRLASRTGWTSDVVERADGDIAITLSK